MKFIIGLTLFSISIIRFIEGHSITVNLIPYIHLSFAFICILDSISFYKLNKRIGPIIMFIFSLSIIGIGIMYFRILES